MDGRTYVVLAAGARKSQELALSALLLTKQQPSLGLLCASVLISRWEVKHLDTF